MQTIKTPMSKLLANKYIDLYCQARKQGHNVKDAHFKAKYMMQEIVINYMVEKPNDISIIQKAYEIIKKDISLQEKAQITYDLSLCNDSIKAKYTHLVMV